MSNLDQEEKDQSTNSGMEDSNAMTVEFLRARLLSERSVSRSARQRADELAERVAELEEQLRIVHIQRTKAEKATADVLAILESNGITEASEAYDSSSDQDTPSESNVGDKSLREEESSVDSKVRKNDSEEISGSDLDYSSTPGRSLSWKGHKDGLQTLEKFKDPTLRRRSSFASVGTSPKHRQGKSCRQIRRKEPRSVPEELKASPIKDSSLEKEVANGSKVSSTGEERDFPENSLEHEQNVSINGLNSNELGEVGDMETALEQQSQLIGQYEEMEKAQREWEEKFRENNNSTPDFCDPGNRSDVTEERFEVKAQTPDSANTLFTETHSAKSEAQDKSKFELNTLPSSHVVMQPLHEQNSSSRPISGSFTPNSSLKEENGKQHQGSLANACLPSSDTRTHYDSHLNDSPVIQSTLSSSSNTTTGVCHDKPSSSQNELYALVPHKEPNQLESVLDALKQAKQSLQQKINTLPLVEAGGFVGKSIYRSLPTAAHENKAEIPIGFTGLFRLPTDLPAKDDTNGSFLDSNTQLGFSSSYYPVRGVPASAGDYFSGRFLETRQSFPPEHQFLMSQELQQGSAVFNQKPYFNPHIDTGLPSSSRYSYPTYPVHTSYPDLMPKIPTREGLARSRTVGTPPPDNFPLLDDRIRPNIYR